METPDDPLTGFDETQLQIHIWILTLILTAPVHHSDTSSVYLHLPDLIRLLCVGLYLLLGSERLTARPHRTSVNVLKHKWPRGFQKGGQK